MRKRLMIGLFFIGLFWFGHWMFIQPAFAHLLTAYVGTLKRLAIILNVLVGVLIFKEAKEKDQLKQRIGAAVLITVGSILISWDGITNKMTTAFENFGL